MHTLPKTVITRCSSRLFTAFFDPTNQRWRVTLGGTIIAEFDNHPDALAYAHRRAVEAQRQHVEKLEHDAYHARRAAEKAAGKRHSEFMDRAGRIWALAA